MLVLNFACYMFRCAYGLRTWFFVFSLSACVIAVCLQLKAVVISIIIIIGPTVNCPNCPTALITVV